MLKGSKESRGLADLALTLMVCPMGKLGVWGNAKSTVTRFGALDTLGFKTGTQMAQGGGTATNVANGDARNERKWQETEG
jgi:hypothetical protein